ncbi:MAG TPA: M67 family metallopeptidase [Conexibacter sp.]|nr:M67 family metallopeptidase [Conexibacter sp.]
MRIARELYDRIVAHARAEAPNECCGLVGADGEQAVSVHEAANKHASPLRFELDERDQIRIWRELDDAGHEIGAIYHSHTRTPPEPSQTDVNNAANWPGALWIIVGLADGEPDVRTWAIEDGRVTQVELTVI